MIKDLDALMGGTLCDIAREQNPKLYAVIREALNKGATPKELRKRFVGRQKTITASMVEYIIDEWEKEQGK